MTFTKTTPTVPGFYAFRRKEGYLVKVSRLSEHNLSVAKTMTGEWCRLVPAEEIARAYIEGMEDYASEANLSTWDSSRAKQVAEGKL